MGSIRYSIVFIGLALAADGSLGFAQSINSGTIAGTVSDPSGAVINGAIVQLENRVSGYNQKVTTTNTGTFRFNNIPWNSYELSTVAPGFESIRTAIDIRSAVPVTHDITLKVGEATTSITVEASGALVETDPSAHQDVDRNTFLKLPSFDPGGQFNQAIAQSTGAVAADANGFNHPLGDHGQTTVVIDGQPISDQQSKLFSTQIPLNAIQGMELITGSPDAQYGDKSSMVINATTRSALGITKTFGDLQSSWGSFGTWAGAPISGLADRSSVISSRLTPSAPATFWTLRKFSPFTTAATIRASLIGWTGSPMRTT